MKTASLEEVAAIADPSPAERALRRELRTMERRLDSYKEEHGDLQGVIDAVARQMAKIKAPQINYKAPTRKKVATPVGLVVHATDWHNGAVVEKSETEGFNQFSPDILQDRIYNWADDLLRWTTLHRSGYEVQDCYVLVTSDMVSGGLHYELTVTDAYPAPVQAVESGKLLAGFVSKLSPHFRHVYVHYIGIDNHGRLTKKLQHNEGGYNTWNYVVSSIAEEMLKEHKNVEWNYYPSELQVVDVLGRRYLLTHGHNVTGWAGFPYYGIERVVGKEATRRMQTGIGHFDKMVLGHWHAPLEHPNFLIGGSAQGTSSYDHANGRHSPPIQCSWFVHPRHNEFDRTNWVLKEDG